MKTYYWLVYPVVTICLIVISAKFLVGGQNQAWFKLLTQHQKVVTDRAAIASLQKKLTALELVNTTALQTDLAWLDQVIPRKKQIDVLVNELRFAGQSAGAVLSAYTGTVGQISGTATDSGQLSLQASYIVPDFSSTQALLSSLENSLPLLKITQANYTGTSLTVTIVSSWAAQATLGRADVPLPAYTEKVQQLRTQLANYQIPLVLDVIVASSESAVPLGTGNPFTALPR